MGGERISAVKPSVLVGTLNAVPIAAGSALLGAVPLTPRFQQVVLSSVVPNWQGVAYIPTFLVLTLFGVVLGGIRALVRHLTVEYRICENRVEIVTRGAHTRRKVLPRSQIRHVTLSAGVLAGHVGGGTLDIAVRGPHTKVDIRLREVRAANRWYEELRTVTGTVPRQTVSRAIAPGIVNLLAYLFVGVAVVGTVTALGLTYSLVTVTPQLLFLGAVLVCVTVLSAYHLYISGVKYVFYDDHIERRRIFVGTERSYVSAAELDEVEHARSLSERVFDVGTVSLSATWHDEPFHIRAVDDSLALYERLREAV